MPNVNWLWPENAKATDKRTVILRIGLVPPREGHIQEVYSPSHQFGWKDKSKFLIIQTEITKAQYDKIMGERSLKLKLNKTQGGIMTTMALNKYKINRALGKSDFEASGQKPVVGMGAKLVDLSGKIGTAPMAWHRPLDEGLSDGSNN